MDTELKIFMLVLALSSPYDDSREKETFVALNKGKRGPTTLKGQPHTLNWFLLDCFFWLLAVANHQMFHETCNWRVSCKRS